MEKYKKYKVLKDWEMADEGFAHSGDHKKGEAVMVKDDFAGALINEGKIELIPQREEGMMTLQEAKDMNDAFIRDGAMAEEETPAEETSEEVAPADEEVAEEEVSGSEEGSEEETAEEDAPSEEVSGETSEETPAEETSEEVAPADEEVAE